MGIDCADIHRMYHYGPPSFVEQYMQETGRAGCDGFLSQAILLYGKPGRFAEDETKLYGEKTQLSANRDYCFKTLFAIIMKL